MLTGSVDDSCTAILPRGPSNSHMGHTPGQLSKAMSWHIPKAVRPVGSTKVILSSLATAARLSHNPVEADLKEVQTEAFPGWCIQT